MSTPSEASSSKPSFFRRVKNAFQAFVAAPQTDIKLSMGSPEETFKEIVQSTSKIPGRVLSHEYLTYYPNRRGDFVLPPYDLGEVARAMDVEPYVYQSVRKHRELILKDGYHLDGNDQEMVDYIKRRLFDIQVATGIPTKTWIRDLAFNLVAYHNAQLILRRDRSRSTGARIRLYGKELEPIAGIFVTDPTTMQVQVDRYGTIKRWRQDLGGVEAYFDPRDVIDMTIDRKPGINFGMPYITPVLDDIRALRKLEEIAGTLAAREAYPLYHIKVGSDNRPAMILADGGDEVQVAQNQFEQMPIGGSIVTSERYEVNLISRQGAGLDLIPFLEYFEARVLAGLRLSGVDVGRGDTSNKSTATTMQDNLQDAVRDYQEVLSTRLTAHLIFYLLLEGGYDVTEENMVSLTFAAVDHEDDRAHQNHGLQLYMNNAVTEDEYRKEYLKKQPIPDNERHKLAGSMQFEKDKELAKTAPPKPAGGGSDRTVANRARPANQHGVKPTKTKVTANDYEHMVVLAFDTLKKDVTELALQKLDTQDRTERLNTLIDEVVATCLPLAIDLSREIIQDGVTQAREALNHQDLLAIGSRALDRFHDNFLRKSFYKVLAPYQERLQQMLTPDQDGNTSSFMVFGCLESLRGSLKSLVQDQLVVMRRFGFAYAAKKLGRKQIVLRAPGSADRKLIELNPIVYRHLLPDSVSDRLWELGLEA